MCLQVINVSFPNDAHLGGTSLESHATMKTKQDTWKKTKTKKTQDGPLAGGYMTGSILSAAEQISTIAMGSLNNDGLRGPLHPQLNDTKAINSYSFWALSFILWCHKIYLSFLSSGKKQLCSRVSSLLRIPTHQYIMALIFFLENQTTQIVHLPYLSLLTKVLAQHSNKVINSVFFYPHLFYYVLPFFFFPPPSPISAWCWYQSRSFWTKCSHTQLFPGSSLWSSQLEKHFHHQDLQIHHQISRRDHRGFY